MIERSNETLNFTASGVVSGLKITANVVTNLADSKIIRVDNGMVTEGTTNVATFNMYNGSSLNVNYIGGLELAKVATAIQSFISELNTQK